MRRNFAQVLREGKVDIKKEYSKLYDMFYGKDRRDNISIAEIISHNFNCFYFRGTCLSLEEFDESHNINFVEQPQNFDIDYLVNFAEYIYNFVIRLNDHYFLSNFNKSAYIDHIFRVIEAIGYTTAQEDGGIMIFVPKDNVAISVSKSPLIPDGMSYKVIEYNHHSMKGNLERKRNTLVSFADLLEPKRRELEGIDKSFASDLFYAFNNFNIRHNNIDPSGTKYKKPIGELTDEQLEFWYDNTYQMCLLAFMRLEHNERKPSFDELKDRVVNKM